VELEGDGVVVRARVLVSIGDLSWYHGWLSGLVLEVQWTGVGLALGWYCLVNAWEEVCE
jgi:hypothetical protein